MKRAGKRPKPARDCPRCAASRTRRDRWEAAFAANDTVISLSAHVLKEDEDRGVYSQSDVVKHTNRSAQTLRNHQRSGMRTLGAPTRPKYRMADVLNWSLYMNYLAANNRAGEPFTQREANQFALHRMGYELAPQDFVIVPLHWNHPQRAEWLRLAAEGIRPNLTEQELFEWDESEDADEADHDHEGDA